MTYVNDSNLLRSKLDCVKKVRHYWNNNNKQCDCGEKVRLYIKGRAICLTELIEILNEKGYTIEKTPNTWLVEE